MSISDNYFIYDKYKKYNITSTSVDSQIKIDKTTKIDVCGTVIDAETFALYLDILKEIAKERYPEKFI